MAKTWFITGASSGLGAELATAALEKGDRVAATFRKEEQATTFSSREPGRTLGIVLDVTEEAAIAPAVQQARDAFQQIDVLVNNAGYGTVGAIEEFGMDEIRAQMETNFFGMAAVTKAFIPLFRQQGSGHIVQLSSAAGIRSAAGFGVYNSSKFALEGFSEALSYEMAPFGVRVVLVEPGPFRTEFLGRSMQAAKQKLETYREGPVAKTYEYIDSNNGQQEGDPVKAAHAIVDYVHDNREGLRLPLGRIVLNAFRMKIEMLQKDLDANKDIAVKTVYE